MLEYIDINEDQGRVTLNEKEYSIIENVIDKEYGHIIKCCSLLLKDYHEIYLLETEVKGRYTLINDVKTIKKIIEKNSLPKEYRNIVY